MNANDIYIYIYIYQLLHCNSIAMHMNIYYSIVVKWMHLSFIRCIYHCCQRYRHIRLKLVNMVFPASFTIINQCIKIISEYLCVCICGLHFLHYFVVKPQNSTVKHSKGVQVACLALAPCFFPPCTSASPSQRSWLAS